MGGVSQILVGASVVVFFFLAAFTIPDNRTRLPDRWMWVWLGVAALVAGLFLAPAFD